MQRLDQLNAQFAAQETANFGKHELSHVTQAPADPLLSLQILFREDKFEQKVNLGIGAYKDENGKSYVFPVVREAEAKIVANHTLDKEYLPIDGDQDFNRGARGVLFGWEHALVKDPRCVSIQTLSGTGALKVISDFLHQHRRAPIYVSKPTWGNHIQVFESSGMVVREYRYFDPKTKGLDFAGMIADLKNATPGSCVLLHTCAHNPTGVDPTLDQWKQIAEVCKAN